MTTDTAPCPSVTVLPPGLKQAVLGAAPDAPPMPLREELLPLALAPLQRSLQLHMGSIACLDATIHALCLRISQVQTAVVAEQLCLFEILAQRTQTGSLLMQGIPCAPEATVGIATSDVDRRMASPEGACNLLPPRPSRRGGASATAYL